MIRRPPRATLDRSSAASDVYKRQAFATGVNISVPVVFALVYVTVGFGINPVLFDDAVTVKTCVSNGPAAVSYTHLRAHETVLDLVCRLLLEKKQTQKNTTTHTHTHTQEPS